MNASSAAQSPAQPLSQSPVHAGTEPALPATHPVRATYRLQLGPQMGFRAAAELVPYLARLGISHLYCSPYLRARDTSTHGYDGVDFTRFHPALGTRADFDALVRTLKAHGMGQVIDMVPNHMGIMYTGNAWWSDVLELGPRSRYAQHFDIDWQDGDATSSRRLALPVLGAAVADELAAGAFSLRHDDEAARIELLYHEHALPLSPTSLPTLSALLDTLGEPLPDALAALLQPLSALDELEPARWVEKLAGIRSEWRGVLTEDAIRNALERSIQVFNTRGFTSQPALLQRVAQALQALLDRQAWQLLPWQDASRTINYRRFFDVGDLAAVSVEREPVYEDVHAFMLELVREGCIDGIRVDHIDGLRNPAGYLQRLQQSLDRIGPRGSIWVVAEKILAADETLREDWALHGTTGYDYACVSNGLFVDPSAEQTMDALWKRMDAAADPAGSCADFEDVARQSRLQIIERSFPADLERLLRQLQVTGEEAQAAREAICALVSNFPVYRNYAVDGSSEADRRVLQRAQSAALEHGALQPAAREMLGRIVQRLQQARADDGFVARFQQFTSPVMAKGIEDTAFYRHLRFLPVNDVGDEPSLFGRGVQAFHAHNQRMAAGWPSTMLGASTHDSKRSEDLRLRLDALTSCAPEWADAVAAFEAIPGLATGPDARDRYLVYQTAIGAWPLEDGEHPSPQFTERLQACMLKSVREAKLHSSWQSPAQDYEQQVADFIARLFNDEGRPWRALAHPWALRLAQPGAWASIVATALRCTVPGVPDVYQGCEVLRLSLVDPDNRRPVDFAGLLQRYEGSVAEGMLEPQGPADEASWQQTLRGLDDGGLKLWCLVRLLQLRKAAPALFVGGDYRPLQLAGAQAQRYVAFERQAGAARLLVVAARSWEALQGRCPERAGATLQLPQGGSQQQGPSEWTEVLTGTRLTLQPGEQPDCAVLLQRLPVAVLVPDDVAVAWARHLRATLD